MTNHSPIRRMSCSSGGPRLRSANPCCAISGGYLLHSPYISPVDVATAASQYLQCLQVSFTSLFLSVHACLARARTDSRKNGSQCEKPSCPLGFGRFPTSTVLTAVDLTLRPACVLPSVGVGRAHNWHRQNSNKVRPVNCAAALVKRVISLNCKATVTNGTPLAVASLRRNTRGSRNPLASCPRTCVHEPLATTPCEPVRPALQSLFLWGLPLA